MMGRAATCALLLIGAKTAIARVSDAELMAAQDRCEGSEGLPLR